MQALRDVPIRAMAQSPTGCFFLVRSCRHLFHVARPPVLPLPLKLLCFLGRQQLPPRGPRDGKEILCSDVGRFGEVIRAK